MSYENNLKSAVDGALSMVKVAIHSGVIDIDWLVMRLQQLIKEARHGEGQEPSNSDR